MKKKFKLILLVLFAILLPLSLFIGYKIAKHKIVSFLSNPIVLESVTIIPQDFQMEFPSKLSWSSVKVKFPQGTELFFEAPKILIDLKLQTRRELLNISIDSVYAYIDPPTDSVQRENSLEYISHPDLWLPFRVSVNVNKAAIEVKDIGSWNLNSFAAVKSGREKRFYIRAGNINGTHLAKKLFLNADYRWNEMFSDASISLSDRKSDSVIFILNAPREHLENLSAEINASVASLPFWLKDKWPNKAPKIEKTTLHSNASINVITLKTDFNLSLKTKMGELWQLPEFDVAINARGNSSGISQSEISLKGKNGESVKFKGSIDKNLDGSGELEAKGIDITLGPETLPTDVKFHRITKRGNSITANFTTGAGSNFIANVADLKNPVVTFSATIDSKEPWAVQWCRDMVILANPTLLEGSFSFKEILLKANLKTRTPFAYHFAADEFEVSLWLKPDGIRFPKGTIKRYGYESHFSGEVLWEKETFTFKVNQKDGGETEVFGTFAPQIDLRLKDINTLGLPFADSTMLKGYNGLVSGNWAHDFKNSKGQAHVSLHTVIQNFEIKAKSDVEIFGNSLTVKNFEMEQDKKKIEGFLYALLPYGKEKFEIQQASINIPHMDLVSLLAAFNDSTLIRGYADGKLEYSKSMGFVGNLSFSKIVLRNLDTNTVRFSDLRLNASGQTAKLSTSLFWQEGLWNGNLEAGIYNLGMKNDFPISVSYEAKNIDNIGKINFEGFLSKDFKKISGNTRIKGDWFLPNGVGEIKDADIDILAKTEASKNILDSLTASFSTKRNLYEFGILKIPFNFNGRIRRGMVLVDTIFFYGHNDEKITAKLQFDLNDATLKDFSFNTELFTISFYNEHWIEIRNGNGRTMLDSAGVSIHADLPTISYSMKSADYGNILANFKGHAEYRYPFKTEQAQTNPSITGNFEIGRASYRKNFDLLPDPLHLDRTIKSINKFISNIGRERGGSSTEMHALTGRPTILNIRIQTGMEATTINSNVADFAFVANVSVLGTTRNTLLSGDINTIGNGKIGYSSLAMFDLSSFRIHWPDAPIRQGIIELNASNNYPLCYPSDDYSMNEDNCTIFVNVSGRLARLNMQPTSNCSNIDASPALIYYSMLLGCISSDFESGSVDRGKFAGKVLGKAVSSGLNRIFGENTVGDVDIRTQWLSDKNQEQDTSYVRVPFNLSRWIPNLEAVLGWSSDESRDPRYDQSYEFGLRYKLPVFDSTDINRNLIDPSLDISANLVARRYLTTIESAGAGDETRLEKNIGLIYSHKFWDPCILGFGYCKIAEK
jgi:hypothetical protein